MRRILVAGAGNGGFAAAVHLTLLGWEVSLYNRSEETLDAVRRVGGIRFEGVLGNGFAPVRTATTDMREAIDGTEIVLVTTPAMAHPFMATALAPHLKGEQTVVLNPGGMLGALAFQRALRSAGCAAGVRLGETGTMTHICRKQDAGSILITSALKNLPFSSFPGRDAELLAASLIEVIPTIVPCRNILECGLGNVNAILHPPAMVLAAAWIEATGGDFYYYYDTAVPAVAHLMEAMDRERLAVADGWGIKVPSFIDYFAAIGSTTPEAAASGDYRRVLLESHANRYIKAPSSLDHRYLHEDIPAGVVPLAELGKLAGIPTPVLDSVITIATTANRRDYRGEGRNLESLGLAGLSKEATLHLLWEGHV